VSLLIFPDMIPSAISCDVYVFMPHYNIDG
jgi:hypothetical protein